MFKNFSKILVVFIATMLIFASCSRYQRLLKSTDYELKYTEAIKYYKSEDYYRAKTLFEELIPIYRGTDKAEEIYYYYAYCNYNEGDHIIAGYYFKNFANMYPNSKHVEEAEYMSAYCAYLNSPEPELDQEYTYKAINQFQLFINKYPDSKYIPECNQYLDKLRKKLEDKAYINAKLYYNLGDYKAAVVVLENTLNKYPDTSYREELMFINIKSHFKLAENSIASKQAKRYQDTIDAYYNFIDEFPNSKYLKEAQKMYENSVKKLKKV